MKRMGLVAAGFAGLLILTACSSGTEEAATSASSSPSPSASASVDMSVTPSESPSAPETILAVLCDGAQA